jgi:photosystem II stability/assembly factor-like uncharacterized protein
MRSAITALVISVVFVTAVHAADLRNFDDAALRAVQFVDDNEGWVVGDDGVVWHTVDGGQQWELQPTGVRASLRSVHFLNPYTGWVAGREELPHQQGSVGMLLFTTDGGVKWRRMSMNALPGLNHVRFVSGRVGFVVGDGTDQYPTGIFRTADGGRTWHAVSGPRRPAWLAADFQDADTGAVVGAWGWLSVLRDGKLFTAEMDTLGGRAVRSIQVVGQRAVAVGDGGLVLVSKDSAGARWAFAPLPLSPALRADWDFHALHCRENHIWVVGRPGSAALHSTDQGKTWEIVPTQQPLPLHGVFFAGSQRGWAVGEFGSILGTTDGGKTWRVQHRGGQRAAVAFIHARPSGLPVDTVALLGGEEGYLAASLRVLGPDPVSAAPERAADEQRFAAAVRSAGGAAGEMFWQFPVPQHLARADKMELVQFWNKLHGDQAPEDLLRQLVLALRIWRPNVIITDHSDARVAGWPSDALLTEALHEAIVRSADPQSFPAQITQLGLQPWGEVRKVYGRSDSSSGAEIILDLSEIQPHLASMTRDFADPAANLLADAPTTLPGQRYFHLRESKDKDAAAHRRLMQGEELAEGGVARRKQTEAVSLVPEVEKALQAHRNLQAMVDAPASPLTDPNRIFSQVGPLLSGLPDDYGAAAAFGMATEYMRIGQWAMARDLFLLMVERYPTHPRSAEAYRWLIRFAASSEARRRQELGQFWIRSQTTYQKSGEPAATVGAHKTEFSEAVQEIQPGMVNHLELRQKGSAVSEPVQDQPGFLTDLGPVRTWYQDSLKIGARLAAFGPLFANEPSTQFCLQAARRHLAEFEKAKEWYNRFCTEHADGPWRDAAATELWLVNRDASHPPKPLTYCRYASTRPLLDGELTDACWEGAQPLVLRDATGSTAKEYPTEVRLSYDKDYLYLALRCRHPADRYVPPVKVRPRDADLRPFDHVDLILDLDRDYCTYFRLQVDQRGCVCDDCWGDRTWNPRWFVASQSTRDGWQVEAAIPMVELTGDTVTVGHTWACNLIRVLPGRGVQAWSLPADVQPRPEGMGLLMFVEEPAPVGTANRIMPRAKGE